MTLRPISAPLRFHRPLTLTLLALAAAAVPVGAGTEAPAAPRLAVAPCRPPGLQEEIRCGTFRVPEDRGGPPGREITLHFLVLPATGAKPDPEPLFYFAGGPGDAATRMAPAFLTHRREILAQRDVVLVDLRGTGASAALACEFPKADPLRPGFLSDFMPVAGVRACREKLAARTDLTKYTSELAIEDVDELRAALGYPRVHLSGASYGTRAVLTYLRRYPERVRTALLEGAYPPDARGPLTYARDAEDALASLLADCAAEPACHEAFPDPRAELETLLQRLAAQPVTVAITDASTGAPRPLELSRDGLAQTVRYMLYLPATSWLIPLYLHQAMGGDWRPLAETAALFADRMGEVADGFYLAILCAEDTAHFTDAEGSAAAAGTFLGDYRVRQQKEACAEWPHARLPATVLQPVAADVPTLLISGERDPVTPARWAEQVARTLPRARYVVVPDGAHDSEGLSGIECLDQLHAELLEQGSAEGLDLSCIANIRRPPFPTRPLGEAAVALSPDELQRLAGTYAAAVGLEVTVRLEGAVLRAHLPGQPPMVLTPVGPLRCKIEGLPPGYAFDFHLVDGRIGGATLHEGEAESIELTRKP